MKRIIAVITALILGCCSTAVFAKPYGKRICSSPGYECYKVKRGDSWQKLWPNAKKQDVVRRLNRMNIRLSPGMTIAVPKNLARTSVWDISPFAMQISPPGEKVLIIKQKHLAWGAYDAHGELQWWGPVSTGKNYCADVGRGCRTPKGNFAMYHKRGPGCISSKYPVGRGGAKMPYCMFFYRGYAMHGSPSVPGYRASHGCIRLFNEDARWLNQEFIDLRSSGYPGTRVIIEPI